MPDRRITMTDEEYRAALYPLHVELVKLQRHVIATGKRVFLLIEGRDAAGKDGVIKRFTRHLSPRETRVFAPGKPTERDLGSWYFARFIAQLPAAGETVIFNRSWYNRAGVEPVMGFCTKEQTESFLRDVLRVEELLLDDGFDLRKVYIDISREEQGRRLDARRGDPLKQWKISPIDARASELWEDYSRARNEMLQRTHTPRLPWTIVRGNEKKPARIHLLRSLLASIEYEGRDDSQLQVDPAVVFPFEAAALGDGRIAP